MQTPMNENSRTKGGFSFFLFLSEELEEPSAAGLRCIRRKKASKQNKHKNWLESTRFRYRQRKCKDLAATVPHLARFSAWGPNLKLLDASKRAHLC